MKDKVIPLPAEAYNISKYALMKSLDNSSKWWLSQGVSPEWGRFNKYQNLLYKRITSMVTSLGIFRNCIGDKEHKEYLTSIIDFLNNLIPFILSTKPRLYL